MGRKVPPPPPPRLRFGLLGINGPEPWLTTAQGGWSMKALKEAAARALGLVHPETGNVWKPRHVFVEVSGGLEELSENSLLKIQSEQIVWVEPPSLSGDILKYGLTSRHRWGWRQWCCQRLLPCLRLPCCASAFHWISMSRAKSTASRAPGGAGTGRRTVKASKPSRPSHFLSLRVGEGIEAKAAALQDEMLLGLEKGSETGLVEMLKRCMVPPRKLHLSMLILHLGSQAEIDTAKVCMEEAVQKFAREQAGKALAFKLEGLENFGERVLYARIDKDSQLALVRLRQDLEDSFMDKGLDFSGKSIGQGFNRNVPTGAPKKGLQASDLSQEQLSRFLTKVLRHKASNLGLQVRGDGSVRFDKLLELPFFKKNGFGADDVEAEVASNSKQRFMLWEEDGVRRIRANQGHTMKCVADDQLLQQIVDADEIPLCVHGTYLRIWDKKHKSFNEVWDSIKRTGLSRMGRNHIHLVPHDIGSQSVISGMREDCTVAIYLDVDQAMKQGISFHRSANDVILTTGDTNGYIPPELFRKAVDLATGQLLWPEGAESLETHVETTRTRGSSSTSGTDISDLDEEDGVVDELPKLSKGFYPHVTLAKTSRAQKCKDPRPRIPQPFWDAFSGTELGVAMPSSLELCAMKGDAASGYYKIECDVPLCAGNRNDQISIQPLQNVATATPA